MLRSVIRVHTLAGNHSQLKIQEPSNAAVLSHRRSIESGVVHPILQMQQAIGNQAVQRLFKRSGKIGIISFTPGKEIGQRKMYPEPKAAIQAKLAVNLAQDNYEQEADRISEQVAAGSPISTGISGGTISLIRQSKDGDTLPAGVKRALASSGQPIEPGLRQDMEERFGYDFSRVRLHTDDAARESARDINARAYTLGQDIFFAGDQPSEKSPEGRRLIAHELTHTVQQSGIEGPGVSGLLQRQPAREDEIEMPGEYVGKFDRPRDVLYAIVSIMSATDYLGDISGHRDVHPLYYIQELKSIRKKEYIELLWWWFQITNQKVTDKRGIQTIVVGSMARTHISRAAAETAPIVDALKRGGREDAALVKRYEAKIREFSKRAVREEVSEMIEAGVEKEKEMKQNIPGSSNDEQIKGVAVRSAAALQEMSGLLRRALASETADRLNERLNERLAEKIYRPLLREYLNKTFKGDLSADIPGPRPIERISSMSLPDASSNEKAAAAVEATSSALGVASFASRWTPRLAIAGRWGGPIGISLTLNFYMLREGASLARRGAIGLARLDWVSCFRATRSAAQETQNWMRKLAVTNLLMAQETDPARLKELGFAAGVYRTVMMDEHIKPYLAQRLQSGAKGDPHDCGPALSDRFKPMLPLLSQKMENDDAALGYAALFLSISFAALREWDDIVASSIK